jgi:ribonucleotide monophosphatase NagD (HAD superfamily)
MAAAHLLTTLIPAGSTVLVVGGDGLRSAVAERGFASTESDTDAPAAVVQGYGPDVSWRSLAEAAVAVRRGVPWVATNLDATLPSPRGPLPGNGALVGTVVAATGRSPISAGKPELPLHEEAVRRTKARHPLVVGDRLDTDIEGAVRAGCDSLLVLTGVTDVPRLLRASADERPSYIARDLRGLNTSHPGVTVSAGVAACGGWQAGRVGDAIELRRDADAGDALDGVRVVLTASWQDPGPTLRLRGDVAALAEFGLA